MAYYENLRVNKDVVSHNSSGYALIYTTFEVCKYCDSQKL